METDRTLIEKELDQEWVVLIKDAFIWGITAEEIRNFLSKSNEDI